MKVSGYHSWDSKLIVLTLGVMIWYTNDEAIEVANTVIIQTI